MSSQHPGGASIPPHLLQRLAEKQQELDNLLVIRQLSNHLRMHFDELAEKFEALTQGNQAVSKVLENWASVFRTIALTDTYAVQEQEREQSIAEGTTGSADSNGASLVRLPTS
ncbi:hypothetical protein DFQ27_009689 [Actinomortierella ambigua]|uniref:DASH complex subunit DAD2 n=1 Tax=Actinomortierella ambigua TaxID=1343610 RepID=A0A9P6PME7_9FUNG|nr:hypothetical protein DFQ26_004819 [Actinomortierella ambigua]KAG0249962.1 hypothetical protein DFQ27_009689 [Actinomortierella ambigua]